MSDKSEILALQIGQSELLPLGESEIRVGVESVVDYVDENGEWQRGLLVVKDVPDRRSNYWWKVMLADLCDVLSEIPGKQTKALMAVLDEIDSYTNLVVGTQKTLASRAGCSEKTMSTVLNLLIRKNILQKVSNGLYRVHPSFAMVGKKGKYNALIVKYNIVENERKLKSENERRLQGENDSILQGGK